MTGFVQSKIELERDVQNELLNWKNKRHHTVLQIEGPWHVGKTHEVKKFVYSHYKQVVYVNLVRDEYGFEDLIHFLRREMLDFTAFPVFFVSNLLLVQRKKYYFNRATVSRNCSIVL